MQTSNGQTRPKTRNKFDGCQPFAATLLDVFVLDWPEDLGGHGSTEVAWGQWERESSVNLPLPLHVACAAQRLLPVAARGVGSQSRSVTQHDLCLKSD
jgi:hypothetical protein